MQQQSTIERRRSPRVPDSVKMNIVEEGRVKPVPVINISRHGALLRLHRVIYAGETISLNLLLPTEEDPLKVEARVVRTVYSCSIWGTYNFDAAVDFTGLQRNDAEKLTNVIYLLLRRQDRGKYSL